MANVPLRSCLGVTILLGAAACGGKTGDLVRPEDFTGGEVLGASPLACGASPTAARPFTVDLDSATRGDLEADMNDGVVVVAYDCKGLRVLSNCEVTGGSYDYGGFTPQDEVMQITGLDDLAVNLPLGAVKLGGEIKAGRSIDLALVTVGRRSTTVERVGLPDLEGDCTGATHYVQKASLGAFSIATGSVGKVSAIASYFAVGASASSTSEHAAGRRAGSLEDCLKATSTDAEPPVKCRLPLRLDLTPVADDEVATSTTATADDTIGRKAIEAQVNPCPEGFELAKGLCTQAPGTAYLCDPNDEAECREQCDKGSAESCTNLGAWIIEHNDGSPDGWELAKGTAMPILKKACDGGHVEGCAGYARVLFPDEITRKTLAITKQSIAIGKQACTDGSAVACQDVALAYHNGSEDEKTLPSDFDQYREYSERACKLGNHYSCGDAGEEYVNPQGSNAKDPARALAFFDKGCDGGEAAVCTQLAYRLLTGSGGVKKDVARGLIAANNACRNDADECYIVFDWVKAAGEPKVAFAMLERGCVPGNRFLEDSCSLLGDYFAKGIGTKKDVARAKEAWSMSCEGWKVSTPTQAARTSACRHVE